MRGLLIFAALVALVGRMAPAYSASMAIAHSVAQERPSVGKVVQADADADADTLFWQSIMNSNDPEDYEAYLQQFPGGTFAALARARLVKLQGDKVTDFTDAAGVEDFKRSFLTSCVATARSHLKAAGIAISVEMDDALNAACACSRDGDTELLVKRGPMTLSKLVDTMKNDPEIRRIGAACNAKYIKKPAL